MEKLNTIIFYSIDRAIRSYRQFAQKRINAHGFRITIDQWIIIKCILENPDIQQREIAQRVFKDVASVTRIIQLLIRAGYLKRKVNKADRRTNRLTVTDSGKQVIDDVQQLVFRNRKHALTGVSLEELEITRRTMDLIHQNCLREVE